MIRAATIKNLLSFVLQWSQLWQDGYIQLIQIGAKPKHELFMIIAKAELASFYSYLVIRRINLKKFCLILFNNILAAMLLVMLNL